jgi:hypothetical protein
MTLGTYNRPPARAAEGSLLLGKPEYNIGGAASQECVVNASTSFMGGVGVSDDFQQALDKYLDSTSSKAKTYDEGKEPLARLPWAAIDSMSRVQAYGHAKYKDFDNYRKGMEVTRNLSCALRHIRDFIEGADKDHESGEDVLGHALCRIAFVIQNMKDGVAIDDRYSKRETK